MSSPGTGTDVAALPPAGRPASRHRLHAALAVGVYAERADRGGHAFDEWARATAGAAWHALAGPAAARARRTMIAALDDARCGGLDDARLREEFPARAREAYADPAAAGAALALVREAARRTLGMRPYDVQLEGALCLLSGTLAEMQTGEGKTLTAALAACIAAAARVPVHVVTVNDYLAGRDADEMGPLFAFFGLGVGTVVSGMSAESRRAAYARAVTYCTNKELVFDYLKDRVNAGSRASRAQVLARAMLGAGDMPPLLLRGLHFAIVDEADSILIDEARTPLILAERGLEAGDRATYERALDLARALAAGADYEIHVERRELGLTGAGRARLARLAAGLPGEWGAAQAREHLVAQALRALHLYRRDQHYLVAGDKVQIIDEYTGRVLDGRSWERGLHQMIEVKEECPLSQRTSTLARITFQRFFRRYLRLSGMSGTAHEVRGELRAVYGLETERIPTHRPSARITGATVCCRDEAEKWRRVAARARELSAAGKPVLIGTRSVAASERLSAVLQQAGVAHRVLNARQDAEEAAIVAAAGEAGHVTVATNMAGRGTDIALGEGVADRGGLHVILTEFHDSPRIDRQLFGRCARQGDPGQGEAIVALDDGLFTDHGGALAGWLARRFPEGPPAAWAARLRRLAQHRAGTIHARMRRDTLRQDRNLDTMLAFAGNQI